jgi:sulfatase maturation enzyme AslB (radical SAM superfamily)
MSLETAQKAISKEAELVRNSTVFDGLKLDIFGGEPFLRFDMIQDLCAWAWSTITDIPVETYITTNGTLLTPKCREWIIQNKERLNICMSVDGDSDMQLRNRGVSEEKLPLEFIHEVFPKQPFKMTISNQTLKDYSRGFLALIKRGYLVDARPATEEEWSDDAHLLYRKELTKIASFYLHHLEYEPCQLLMKVFPAPDEKLDKYCGAGTHMSAYDYDGMEYPCHMFTRIVHGEHPVDFYKQYDFEHPLKKAQGPCVKCALLNYCPTCIGCNFQHRGTLINRDLRKCKMVLAEMKVVSAFQILYMTNLSDKRPLDDKEKMILQRALSTYTLVKNRRFTDL